MDTLPLNPCRNVPTAETLLHVCSLNDQATQMRTTDPRSALLLAEKACAYARGLQPTDDNPLSVALHTELARSLLLLSRCHSALADYTAAEQPATEALELYTALHDGPGCAMAHDTLGLLYWKTGTYAPALEHLHVSLALHRRHDNKALEGRTLNNIGLVYDRLGDYPTALNYLLESLAADRISGDQRAESRTMSNIGIVYSEMGDFQQALDCYRHSLAYEERIQDSVGQCSSLNNIGVVYGRMQQHETALEYFNRSLLLRRELNDTDGEALVLCNIGETLVALDLYDDAVSTLQTSLRLHRERRQQEGITRTLIALGSLYRLQGDDSTALDYLHQALPIAEATDARRLMASAHEQLYELYRRQGDAQRALAHHEHLHSIRESIYKEANARKIATLQTLHQVQSSRMETEIYRLKNVELARANEQLHTLNREKNDMLGIVAHDLKNPLSTIRLLARLLCTEAETLHSDDIRDYSSDIDLITGRMFELIDNLLDINRIETQGLAVNKLPCDVAAIVRDVIDSHSCYAAGKSITLVSAPWPEHSTATIDTDPTLVRQVIDNLLSNAIKFSPVGSTVRLCISADSAMVKIAVQDEGPGLTEDDRRKLFTKFARLSARPTADEHSTGLGLSIVKKMVEALDGAIHCDSVPGEGATFTVELPR